MSNYRNGQVTHKMVVADYDLLRMNVNTKELEKEHKTLRGNWTYNKVWEMEYTAAGREREESGRVFINIENYKERLFIVGMPQNEYFAQAKILKEIRSKEEEYVRQDIKLMKDIRKGYSDAETN